MTTDADGRRGPLRREGSSGWDQMLTRMAGARRYAYHLRKITRRKRARRRERKG